MDRVSNDLDISDQTLKRANAAEADIVVVVLRVEVLASCCSMIAADLEEASPTQHA